MNMLRKVFVIAILLSFSLAKSDNSVVPSNTPSITEVRDKIKDGASGVIDGIEDAGKIAVDKIKEEGKEIADKINSCRYVDAIKSFPYQLWNFTYNDHPIVSTAVVCFFLSYLASEENSIQDFIFNRIAQDTQRMMQRFMSKKKQGKDSH